MKYLMLILGMFGTFVGGWTLGYGSVVKDWHMAIIGGLLMIAGVMLARMELR